MANYATGKLTAEGQRFSSRRVLTSSMHIPFCPTHIPFIPTHWCWHLVCTFHSSPPTGADIQCAHSIHPHPLVLMSSMHLGWTTRFWHKILQHILSECITDSSLWKLNKFNVLQTQCTNIPTAETTVLSLFLREKITLHHSCFGVNLILFSLEVG